MRGLLKFCKDGTKPSMRRYTLIITLLLAGCHPKAPLPAFKIPAEKILERVEEASQENIQLFGRFKIRSTGVKKLFGSVDMDMIARFPHKLYLSIDSFFGQPGRVVTYDGENIYGMSEAELQDITYLPVEPSEFIDLVLRRFTYRPGEVANLTVHGTNILVTYHSGDQASIKVDPKTFKILKRERRNARGELVYWMSYPNFPKRYGFEVLHDNELRSMTLSSKDAQLNEGTFNEQLFNR
ncbi:MAG: hypothetical protein JKY15_03060 [Deltaproteobacteria bacterium]|nr:hypothetical protein [Deltaproteobacteria bacterium]